MQDNPIQQLREASERATPGPYTAFGRDIIRPTGDGLTRFMARVEANDGDATQDTANAAFLALSANYVRSILNSPDEAAVERAEDVERVAREPFKREAQTWKCAARQQGTSGGNDPTDCEWPACGCDPYAEKVIAALEEMGLIDIARSQGAGS